MGLMVIWKSEKLDFEFSDLSKVTVQDLKNFCSVQTGIDSNDIKLLYSGIMLKDTKASLDKFGMKANSKLMMLASQPTTISQEYKSKRVQESVPQLSRSEQLLIQRLNSLQAEAREVLQPMVKQFSQTDMESKSRNKEYARLSELIMQALLRVDNINCESDMEAARQKRKETVAIFQSLLSTVDQCKEKPC